jgi:hypothetical protein
MATSARDLADQEFEGLPLSEPYASTVGKPWTGFQMLMWGPKGAGKSTQSLLLGASLVPHAAAAGGTVMVLAAEEGVGVGVQRRLERVGIPEEVQEHMMIKEWEGMENLKSAMKRHDVRWLIVDSISVVDVAGLDLIDYCRDHGIGTILVAHARKGGWTYKGNSKIGHEVDAVLKAYRSEGGSEYDEGEYMLEVEKNRAVDAPPPPVSAPANVAALGPHPDPEAIMRENPDCSVGEGETQSDRCKAIMASLRSEGEISDEAEAEEAATSADAAAKDVEEPAAPEETDTATGESFEEVEPEDEEAKELKSLIGQLGEKVNEAVE